ncbi:hypothetical protein [Barrientosiimonas endolithica]|uniref:hypothetical protein n=1 Tax=Barrientosiimonas endolithica TaxID=1535208 RepID=UPI00259BDDD5|nr:hypothetical protein [Barrientosiimonas endolithica]
MAGAAVAGACVRLWSSVLPRVLQGPGWQRTNHAGRTVSLVEGPAVVAGCGVAVAGSPAAGLAALAAGGLGLWDDLAGDTSTKGLRGHLRALTRGEVTTGALKVIGLGVVGLASAAATDRRVGLGTLAGAGVVAGTANLVNLFDLRPGRALKVTVLLGLPMAYGGGSVPGRCWAPPWPRCPRTCTANGCSATPAPTRSGPSRGRSRWSSWAPVVGSAPWPRSPR